MTPSPPFSTSRYYGRNLDALADCLGDVAHGDYGWNAERTGLAVTLDNFGAFAREQPGLARALADLLAGTSRYGLAFGHRLVWLLSVDGPRVPARTDRRVQRSVEPPRLARLIAHVSAS